MAEHLAEIIPHNGGPEIRFFESSQSMEQFDQVAKWLKYFCKKVSIKEIIAQIDNSIGTVVHFFLGSSLKTILKTTKFWLLLELFIFRKVRLCCIAVE